MAQPLRSLFSTALVPVNEAMNVAQQGANVPQARPQAENPNTFNQVNKTPPQMGSVSLNDYLERYSREKLEEHRNFVRQTQINDALITADANIIQGSAAYLKKNRSGEGYTEAMSTLYSSTFENVSNIYKDDEFVRNAILNQGKSRFNAHLESWANTELKYTTEACVNQNKLNVEAQSNQVRIAPEFYDEALKNMQNIFKSMEGKIPARELNKFMKESLQDLNYQYGYGRLQANPFNWKSIMADKRLQSLDRAKYDALITYAEHKTTDLKTAEREERAIQSRENIERLSYVETKISEKDPNFTRADIEADPILTGKYKQQALKAYANRHREEIDQSAANKEIEYRFEKGLPLDNISVDKQIGCWKQRIVDFKNRIAGENSVLPPGAQPKELTSIDEVKLYQGFTAPNIELRDRLHGRIRTGDPEKVLNASIAYLAAVGSNPNVFGSFNSLNDKYYVAADRIARYNLSDPESLGKIVKSEQESLATNDEKIDKKGS